MTHYSTNPKKTVLVIAIGFSVILLLLKLYWFIIAPVLLVAAGLLSEHFRNGIDFVWMKLAWLLNITLGRFILILIFYLILFPVALLSKLFGKKDPLQLNKSAGSMFKTVQTKFDKNYFEKPW